MGPVVPCSIGECGGGQRFAPSLRGALYAQPVSDAPINFRPAGPSASADWPLAARLAWLRAFTRQIMAYEPELTAAIEQDVGKPAWQALTGDVLTLLHACAWHRRRARKLLRARAVRRAWTLLPGTRVTLTREPLGFVAIIATWNYPVQLLGIQLVQALMAGNRVVVKPCERSPLSQLLLLRIARAAGAPGTHLAWAEATREAGPALLDAGPGPHLPGVTAGAGWDHVVFTGSTAVGRQIAAWAGPKLVGTTLELSGNDSAIVLGDANVRLAARTIFAAMTLNSGQTCLAPRRVLVMRRAAGPLLDELAVLVMNHPPLRLIDAGSAAQCAAMVKAALAGGAANAGAAVGGGADRTRVLAGTAPMPEGEGGCWLRPVVVVDPPLDSDLVTCVARDHFGPVLAVVPVADVGEALRIHRSCGQHLSASVFTRDVRAGRELAAELGASLVTINDCVIPGGHPGVAITGHGASGWGASRGEPGLLALTRPVYVTTTGRVRPAVGPVSGSAVAWLRFGLGWMFGRSRKLPLGG